MELKVYPPAVALVAALLMWLLSLPGPELDIGGLTRIVMAVTSLAAGAALLLSAFFTFRKHKTTYHPKHVAKAKTLLSTGVFAYSRNPMYLGMALVLLAWGFYLAAPLAILGLAFFVIYINHFQIRPEERALQSIFGQDFIEYCSRVRRWL